ncbi:branched chain amino acid aminotransferase [Nitrospira sp. KM1]|uniref:aminotransferase class IV n=1 Tax=Nitrospira sp. KM1 TaxID=1936990 RepID=UPI0013A7A1DD|nr:aminotransferase class IV [Nitrospira sp. KM1]BCA54127.1 branched chain amino acid aminotransferase [Nitrospira sp. KM1]
MAQLQRPTFAYMNGHLVPWEQASLHIGCEAVTRGLNVFEGLKGYWQADGTFKVVMMRHHYERLKRSARLLHIPCEYSFEQYHEAVNQLIGALVSTEKDMWARTTLFVTDGHWGENTVSDLVLTAYHQEKKPPQSIKIGVSTWRRSSDVALPARIKTSSNYQVSRLARIEGKPLGCDDMVLLNQSGRVAEATASCLLMVRDETIVTTPATEGALESITLKIVESLAHSMGIKFVNRPIDRTELLVADEIGVCGTLHEVTLATSIDGFALSEKSPILSTVQRRYLDAVRGVDPHPSVELTPLPAVKRMA